MWRGYFDTFNGKFKIFNANAMRKPWLETDLEISTLVPTRVLDEEVSVIRVTPSAITVSSFLSESEDSHITVNGIKAASGS